MKRKLLLDSYSPAILISSGCRTANMTEMKEKYSPMDDELSLDNMIDTRDLISSISPVKN